jgi:hypothetical protein
MKEQYRTYLGGHENIMGHEVYIKFPTGYVYGKVVEYVFPKHGIIGTYKVKRKDGKIMSATVIYIKE